MIDKCAIWLGKAPMLYADAMAEWISLTTEENGLHDHDVVTVSLSPDTDVPDLLSGQLTDDDVWMSPTKLLILRGAEHLKAAAATEIMDHLRRTESVWQVAIEQASGAVLKAVEGVLTDRIHDFRLPDRADNLADFGRQWLRERGVEVQPGAMRDLAEYSGEDRSQFAAALVALSSVRSEKKALDWDDVRVHTGPAGAVKVFDITNAIARGDRESAVVGVLRLGDAHPLQLAKMLENRYRGYIGLLGGGNRADVAKTLGLSTSPFALNRMESESKALGTERSIRSLQIVQEAQSGMKGGSQLPAEDIAVIMVDKLSRLFAAKK